jgi:signal transduction histidine kinase
MRRKTHAGATRWDLAVQAGRPVGSFLRRIRFTPAHEAEFQREWAAQAARLFRVFAPVGILTYTAYLFWDWNISPAILEETSWIRGAFAVLTALVIWASYRPQFERLHGPLISLVSMAAGVGVAAILWIAPGGFENSLAGLMLVIMYTSGAFRMSLPWALATFAVIFGAANFLMVLDGVDSRIFVSNEIHLVSAVLLGLLYSHIYEVNARRTFQLERHLVGERERSEALFAEVEAGRRRRIRWLEGFARFLRHELKNQLIGVRTSLDLLERRPDPALYVHRARRSVQVMQRLLAAASEATSIESALADDVLEPLDLAAAVRERVQEFAEMHPDRRFEVLRADAVTAQASATRVIQLLDKLLGNAVEHGDPAGTIGVAVGLETGEAVLRVENSGVPLPEDSERLFDPFTSGAGGPRSAESLGIGLYVARTIARHHGASLEGRRRHDGSGAVFELRFPAAESPPSAASSAA